jgi:hypothetical protein
VRIGVAVDLGAEQEVALGEVFDDLRVGVLHPQTGELPARTDDAPARIDHQRHGKVIAFRNDHVVLTVGSHVHDPRAILGGYELAGPHRVRVIGIGHELKRWVVLAPEKVTPGHLLDDHRVLAE